MISLLSSERYCESNKPTRLGLNCLRIFARLVAEDQVPSPPVTKETPRSSFAKVGQKKTRTRRCLLHLVEDVDDVEGVRSNSCRDRVAHSRDNPHLVGEIRSHF